MFKQIVTNWSPFGDKTAIGWTITAAYFVATVLTFLAFRRERLRQMLGAPGIDPVFWRWLTWGMLLLGINKQLDLQRLVTRFGRLLALHSHLYARRQPFQVAFIGMVALVGLAIVVFAAVRMRRLRFRYVLALFGIGFLAVFVVARAASFHKVDRLLGVRFHNVYVNTFLELGGIVWVSIAAVLGIISKPSRTAEMSLDSISGR